MAGRLCNGDTVLSKLWKNYEAAQSSLPTGHKRPLVVTG